MAELKLKPYTIVLLVGPSNSGKSLWMEKLLDKPKDLATVISSDDIRRYFIQGDEEIHKYDPRMLEVSQQAFDVLIALVKANTSFPVNRPYVFIDTRGMSEDFRTQIRDIASKNHYHVDCILFDYKNIADYGIGLEDEDEIKFTRYDVKRFRTEVLPVVRKKDYHEIFRVKSFASLDHLDFDLEYPQYQYDTGGKRIAIIGDVHECADQFLEMHSQLETLDGETIMIQLGDWIDKGNNTAEMINIMEAFMKLGGYVIHGNHEAYVYYRLFSGTSVSVPPEFEDKFFGSLKVLFKDSKLAERFKAIYDKSLPYMVLSGEGHRTVYVTHSPCEEKYLGKDTPEARRNQRNLSFRKGIDPETYDVREAIPFIFSEAQMTKPFHVFGHLAHNCDKKMFKNKVFVDTGCVNGGKLTAFILDNNRYDFIQVQGREGKPDFGQELTTVLTQPLVTKREFNIRDYDLTNDELKFVRRTVRNGVKYISGTMSPSPSADGELEPISSALTYYKNKGVEKVVLEPKHMGSRCQVYLHKNEPEKDFCVSRNGYVIKHVEGLDNAVKEFRANVDEFLKTYGWQDHAIFDCELLPWSALGRGLIDYQFNSYGGLVRHELESLKDDAVFADFDIGKALDIDIRLDTYLSIFDDTLKTYSYDAPPSLEAFHVLMIDGNTDVIEMGMTSANISGQKTMVVDLNDYNIDDVKTFFTDIAYKDKKEGVVVKPLMFYKDLPPKTPEYMKVRNERYLTLVYGYDYKLKYERLVRQKNISGKAAVSIRESALGQNMLKSTTEAELTENVVKMVGELKREKELDPRL